jgi:hypothetical protein
VCTSPLRVGLKSSRWEAVPCELSRHQPDAGDKCPGGGTRGGFLPIFGETQALAKPGESSFNNPPARENVEALGAVGSFQDRDGPDAVAVKRSAQLVTRIAAVSEDVALSTFDLLARIVAGEPSALARLHALAVDDTGGRTGLSPLHLSRAQNQEVIDHLPKTAFPPPVEGALHRGSGRKILGQHLPLAAAGSNRCREWHPSLPADRSAAARLLWAVAEGVPSPPILGPSCRSDIEPMHADVGGAWSRPRPSDPPLRYRAVESQPINITQLLFGPALRNWTWIEDAGSF